MYLIFDLINNYKNEKILLKKMEFIKYKNSLITKILCLFTLINDIIVLYDFLNAKYMNESMDKDIANRKYITIQIISEIRLWWALCLSIIVLIALFFTRHKHWIQHIFIFRIIYLYFLNEEILLSKFTIGLNVLNSLAQTTFSLMLVIIMYLTNVYSNYTIRDNILNTISLILNFITIIFTFIDAYLSIKGYKILVTDSSELLLRLRYFYNKIKYKKNNNNEMENMEKEILC